MRQWMTLPWFAIALAGCSARIENESRGSQSDELVGGHVATAAEYPATVDFGGCTGVKVGPRHFLSAGHCFAGSTQQYLSVTADHNAQNFQFLSIASINVDPEYLNCTACNGTDNDFGLKPDVSLVIVHELTPNIAEAIIDPNTAQIGDPVTLTGYGCENGVGQPSGPPRLKVGDSHVADPFLLSNLTNTPGAYVTTLGPALSPGSPGICPGDSGGPLYRTGTNLVVGVNAVVSFGGPQGTPFGAWHTRVDRASRANIFSWLTTLISQAVPQPCDGICSTPTTITSQYFSSENLGTGARCFEGTAQILSGNCGGFVSPRTLSINGTTMTCNGQNWTLPAKHNGGYCFQATAGQNFWAWFTTF